MKFIEFFYINNRAIILMSRVFANGTSTTDQSGPGSNANEWVHTL